MRRNRRNRRNNGTIKMYAVIIAASIVLILSGLCIFLLYFTQFFPVYINGEINIARKIIRYVFYFLCFAMGAGAGLCINAALERIKEYTKIKKTIARWSR